MRNDRQTPVLDSLTPSELDELLLADETPLDNQRALPEDSQVSPTAETVNLDSMWETETIDAFNRLCDEAGERERLTTRRIKRAAR